jgi:hypothetical protein
VGRGVATILVLLLVMSVRGAGSERLSHREYVARAAAVCYEMTSSMLSLQTGGKDAEFRRTAGIIRRGVKKLKRLSPPKADERQHDVLTDSLAHVAQILDDYPPLNREDGERRLFIVHKSAHDLGIRAGCGSG